MGITIESARKIVGKTVGNGLVQNISEKLNELGLITSLNTEHNVIDYFITDRVTEGFRELYFHEGDDYIMIDNSDNDEYIEVDDMTYIPNLVSWLKRQFDTEITEE